MPYVHVRITREGNTPAQKKAVIEGVTQVLVDVLNKDAQTTFVVIDEVDLDNWGIGGTPVRERRKAAIDIASDEQPGVAARARPE